MKNLILAITFLVLLANPARALAAEADVPQKTFLAVFMDKISSMFNSGAQASEDSEPIGDDRLALLKELNTREMKIRTSMNGTDMYLARDAVLTKTVEFRKALAESGVGDESKKFISDEITKLEEVYNLDLTEKPQDVVLPVSIAFLDTLEVYVFKLTDEEATEILTILKTIEIVK